MAETDVPVKVVYWQKSTWNTKGCNPKMIVTRPGNFGVPHHLRTALKESITLSGTCPTQRYNNEFNNW